MVQQDSRRPPRSRAGWIAVLCVAAAALAGIVFFSAWVVGGRVQSGSFGERLLPAEDQGAQAGDDQPVDDAAASVMHQIPVEQLDQLRPLGWNVAQLSGYGLEPQQAETQLVDGVRTVDVELSNGDSVVEVAETRAEEEGAELTPLRDLAARSVDLEEAEHQEIELSTGDEGDLYRVEDSAERTVTVGTSYAHYVITSDMDEVPTADLAAWVLVTDRSRLQVLPTEEAGVLDRIGQGLREIFSW